ncbi:MAG: MarR family winged helix-turn-helix transcriptional regulator [Caulobacteraceae bacterium]
MAEAKTRTKDVESDVAGTEAEVIRRSRLSRLLGFRLRRAETAMHRDFIQSLKPCDLSQKHFAVLLLIQENAGISQIELCSALGADPNTMIAFIDRLSDRGLVCRIRSAVDRRKTELHPTDEGLQLLGQALALVAEHEARFRSRFTADEVEQLMDFLDRLSA